MRKLISGTKDHFYSKFKILDNGCWEWQSQLNSVGYGRYQINQKKVLAHRFSYEIHVGKIPEKLCILHLCDTPKCVNPDHLKIGTHKDNMGDASIKGRTDKLKKCKGENVGTSVLSNNQVREIKNKLKNGEIGLKLAKEYGVTKTTIYGIKNNKWWRHI